MGHKAAETTQNINTFGPGTVVVVQEVLKERDVTNFAI